MPDRADEGCLHFPTAYHRTHIDAGHPATLSDPNATHATARNLEHVP